MTLGRTSSSGMLIPIQLFTGSEQQDVVITAMRYTRQLQC